MSDDTKLVRDPVVNEAIKRFRQCVQYEQHTRNLQLEDLKFAEADSDNMFQWPNAVRRNRDMDERPCLTVNKTRQHNLQIINDAKQNKPSIVYRATGNGATYESANTFTAIARHIEYQSNAQSAYGTATGFQVKMGIGWLRLARDYAADDTFDQEIYIRRVVDPFSIYSDPDAKEADKSDMKFAFVFDDVQKDEFDEAYPDYKGWGAQRALGSEVPDGFITDDHIRVCEYFRKVEKKDQILAITDPRDGKLKTIRKSQLPPEMWQDLDDDVQTLKRTIWDTKVERFLIIGERVAEKTEEPGRYIPLVPVIGEETVIDGVMDRKGHTRAIKDPQRIYNYWTSSAVENVALQGKTPWIAPAQSIEDYEGYWNTANKVNHSVLPYNAYDDAGNPLPPPSRPEPPTMAPAYISGMQIATNEMMMVSGQYQPAMGEPSNERSGKALAERQRQGDNATYHFIDNLGVAIRCLGKMILDLVPRVYDTKRVMQVMAVDGTDYELEIDPQAKKSFEQHLNHDNQVARRIFNPSVGKYDVQADIGPAYGTQRQQMFDALTTLLTQAPNLANILGDIWMRAADFPGADEAALRFKRMLPPQALGEGPTQAETALQGQVQSLTQLLQKAIDELATEKLKLKGKDSMREIDAFEADTHRLKVIGDSQFDKGQLKLMVAQLMHEITNNTLDRTIAANEPQGQGDSQGADGGGQ
jgi:hypothetical protein